MYSVYTIIYYLGREKKYYPPKKVRKHNVNCAQCYGECYVFSS